MNLYTYNIKRNLLIKVQTDDFFKNYNVKVRQDKIIDVFLRQIINYADIKS